MRLALIPLAFFAGTLASRALLYFVPQRFVLDLAQPIPIVTWWGASGWPFVGILFATCAVAFAAYTGVLERTPALRGTTIAAAAALCAGLFWSPLLSSDVYAYTAYGEMLRLGINPYGHAIASNDPIVSAAQWQWSGSLPACVYGPLFLGVAWAVVAVMHWFPPALQIGAFRIVSCIAFLGCVLWIARAGAAGDEERGRNAALFLGLNPVALWAAIEGHNDTLMLLVAIGGVALSRRHALAGAFVASLSGLVKIPGIVAGIALRRNAGSIAGIVVTLLASIPLFYAAAHDVAPHGRYAPFASVQSVHPILALVLAALVLIQIRTARTQVDRYALLALAAWLAIPNPYPWYSLWLLPLAAWASDRHLRAAAVLVSAAALLRYIPDAVAIPQASVALLLGLCAFAAYGPLLRRAIIVRS